MSVYKIKMEFTVYDDQHTREKPQQILDQITITVKEPIKLGLTEKLEISLVPEDGGSGCAYRMVDSLKSIDESIKELLEYKKEVSA